VYLNTIIKLNINHFPALINNSIKYIQNCTNILIYDWTLRTLCCYMFRSFMVHHHGGIIWIIYV